MNIEILKSFCGGSVKAIASKSQAHRMLICAALADTGTIIKCGETSDDINATAECLRSLGAVIKRNSEGFTVEPIKRPISGDNTFTQQCKESGSTFRFMLPVCCALGVNADFVLDGRLSQRPMAPLFDQLTAHGCEISKADNTTITESNSSNPTNSCEGDVPFTPVGEHDTPIVKSSGNVKCSGKLDSGIYEIPGNVSSQFISGLLLALSLLDGDSVLSVVGREESRPYIAMTLDALNMFGIEIKRFMTNNAMGATYGINGSQRYSSPGKVSIEGDWSNAAFWLCAGAIGDSAVTCTGLNLGSTQGDMSITRLLERFGADVAYDGNSVTVKPAKLHGIQIDAIDTPDLVPALSVVASVAEGVTVIHNAGRLKMKESNRLQAITETLYDLGADITESRASLLIRGKSALVGGMVSSFDDHRIAMMAAIASKVCDNPVMINNAEAVNKSYPGFFKDFEALGGRLG